MADRDLDVRIARDVFGYEVDNIQVGPTLGGVVIADWHYRKPGSTAWKGQRVPRYSSDIGAAMKVFEVMVEAEGVGSINADMEDSRGDGFIVSVSFGFDPIWIASGPLPEAICRAALSAAADGRGA